MGSIYDENIDVLKMDFMMKNLEDECPYFVARPPINVSLIELCLILHQE